MSVILLLLLLSAFKVRMNLRTIRRRQDGKLCGVHFGTVSHHYEKPNDLVLLSSRFDFFNILLLLHYWNLCHVCMLFVLLLRHALMLTVYLFLFHHWF